MLFWTILGHFWCSVKTLVTGVSKCNTFKNKTKNLNFPNLNRRDSEEGSAVDQPI